MTINYTTSDIEGFIKEQLPPLFYPTEQLQKYEWSIHLPDGKGEFAGHSCNDFNLFETSVKKSNTSIRTEIADQVPCLTLAIALKGSVAYRYNQIKEQKTEQIWLPGYANIISTYGNSGYCRFNGKEDFHMLEIMISAGFFERIVHLYPDTFGKIYQRFTNGESFLLSSENVPVTPFQYRIFMDMLESPIMGNLSRMYLEAKILESLSLFMYQQEQINKSALRISPLTEKDRMKVRQAQEIIHERYLNPPSLRELSLQVGTNECKLKAVFKQVTGNTVFGYLFDYRMEKAISYLKDTDKSIQEIALLVGYEHQTHFSTAFKRKFAQTPSDFRTK